MIWLGTLYRKIFGGFAIHSLCITSTEPDWQWIQGGRKAARLSEAL